MNLLQKGALIYVALVIIFTLQSLTVSVANKKGKSEFLAGLIGLIPILGLVYYLKMDSVRKLSATAIPNIFKPKNILGTAFIYSELVLLAFVVVIPLIYTVGTSLSPTSGILNTIKRSTK